LYEYQCERKMDDAEAGTFLHAPLFGPFLLNGKAIPCSLHCLAIPSPWAHELRFSQLNLRIESNRVRRTAYFGD
jgi:hypothetical protein